MGKSSSLIVRLEDEWKHRIAAAAQREGKSVTAFVLNAAMHAVERTEATQPKRAKKTKPAARGPCPMFFRASCATAKSGGASNYATVGSSLTGALASEVPYDLELEEWEARLRELEALVQSNRYRRTPAFYKEVAAWFVKNLPRCMELIPTRRHESFARGVCEFVDERGIEL